MDNKLFDEEILSQLNRKYSLTTKWKRPYCLWLATDPRLQRERETLETIFAIVPEDFRSEVQHNLLDKNDRNSIAEHYTLSLAAWFIDNNFTVNYHPQFGQQTPDMGIQDPLLPEAVVEVATIFDSQPESRRSEVLNQINDRLEKVTDTVRLALVDFRIDDNQTPKLSHLERQVRDWLSKTPRSDTYQYEDEAVLVEFQIISTGKEIGPVLALWSQTVAHNIDDKPLLNKLEEKIEKYRDLRYPYIVAMVLESREYNDQDVFEVLFGTEQDELPFYSGTTAIIPCNNVSGLFSPRVPGEIRKPHVSAIMFLRPYWTHSSKEETILEFKVRVFPCPDSSYPLNHPLFYE